MSYPTAHRPAKEERGTTRVTRLQRPMTLSEFQKMFAHIYEEKNRRDYHKSSDLIQRLFEEGCVVMELARKDGRSMFRLQLPNIFSWWVALANRMEASLDEALWYKFPGVCPYCMKTGCVCGLEHPEIGKEEKEMLLRRLRKERMNMPKTPEDHRILHARLYGAQNKRIMLIQTAAHLVEEVGEVSAAMRHGNKKDFYDEMADVGSWIFALATRLELVPFDNLVWEAYPYECNMCRKDVCACKFVI